MCKTPCIHITILIAFLVNTFGPLPLVQAQDFRLSAPGVMVHLSPEYDPAILKGLKVHPDNPFRFDFILDVGDGSKPSLNGQVKNLPLQQESTKLIKYFLASLTIPEQDLWVNLSPYEKDRIIPQSFGLTEMGRDLLAEDYMLKQITASLIYPEDEIGKRFWKRIYEEAYKKFGTTNIPVNTFNKVWIVPQKAVVYENAKAKTAYVVEAKLKVMLEQDYLSLSKNQLPTRGHVPEGAVSSSPLPNELGLNTKAPQGNTRTTNESINSLGSQIVREIIIPELTKEINEGKNFAQLRQVYNSLILAAWYKKKIKDSILAQVYADKNKIAGTEYTQSVIPAMPTQNPVNDVELIYQRYLQAFKKGAYNYIKEEVDPITGTSAPRKYFSGGVKFRVDEAMRVTSDQGRLPENLDNAQIVTADLTVNRPDASSRQKKLLEILDLQKVPMTPKQLISLIQAEKGYEAVKPRDVRNDIADNVSLKKHPMLKKEVDREGAPARRDKLLEILNRPHTPAVTPRELTALLQNEEGYAEVRQQTVENDVALDQRLKSHEKLKNVKELAQKLAHQRRAKLLEILDRPQTPQVTPRQLTALLQAEEGYADVALWTVKNDIALDPSLKDHDKLNEKRKQQVIRARRNKELMILDRQDSPIPIKQLTNLLRSHQGYADVLESTVHSDIVNDRRLTGHDQLIEFKEFIKTQINKALMDKRFRDFMRSYAGQTPRKRLWVGDLLEIFKGYGIPVPIRPATLYKVLPREIKDLVFYDDRIFRLDMQGQLIVKPHSSSSYRVYNFSKIRIKGLSWENQIVEPWWGDDGEIKAFDVYIESGHHERIPASEVITGGTTGQKAVWQYVENDNMVREVVDTARNALEAYESKQREQRFVGIVDAFVTKNHHSREQYMDFLVSMFE